MVVALQLMNAHHHKIVTRWQFPIGADKTSNDTSADIVTKSNRIAWDAGAKLLDHQPQWTSDRA